MRFPARLIPVVAALFAAAPPRAQEAPGWSISEHRGGDRPVLRRQDAYKNYNYDPTVIRENGLYRVWWCANHSSQTGDHILHAESRSLDGPWRARGSFIDDSYDNVLAGSGHDGDFDKLHVCDPTVIKVNGAYYMYYTGAHIPGANGPSAIGVASSADGIGWRRLNDGKPVVAPVNRQPGDGYGAGGQTVTFANGYFYMMYNDHTGAAALSNGAGVFLIRARDPLFREEAMTFTAQGFQPLNASTATTHMLYNGNNVDLLYAPAWRNFVILSHTQANMTHVVVFDENFRQLTDQTIGPARWCDGPGLVGDANRHAIMREGGAAIAIDFLRAVGDCAQPVGWRLAWRGADLSRPAPPEPPARQGKP